MIIGSKFNGYSPDNRRLYYMDGAPSSPTSQTVTQTSIPEYAKPYVESMLGQASALTDVNTNPYMQYQGDRTAQFAPLQQQAFENAALMATAPQLEQGTALAGQAGLMGLGMAGYRPQSFTETGTAQNYMSPYIQNVVDVQQREAKRQADIAAQTQQAQAARAGAFGGARDIINRNEANRALQTQLAGIQASGLQNAFQQAQQQFNAEQQQQQLARQLGVQGLQTAIQSAGQIGGLGQQQFGQAMDINKLQATYGGQQQQQVQNILNQQYQDFLNYQNYPYKQLGFMSDILRGLPLTQQSQSMYAAPPSGMQQLGALGLGAYGLSKMFADGGMVDSYAEGGVTSDQNVENILGKLSDRQLQQAKQIALAQRDMVRVRMIDEELAERASMKQGLGSAFNMLPQDRQDAVTGMAGGGIVAFADEGLVRDEDGGTVTQTAGYTPGSPEDYRFFLQKGREAYEALGQDTPYVAPTAAERAKFRTDYLRELEEGAGPSPYAEFRKKLEEQELERAGVLEQGKGIAALQAASAMLEGRGFAQGVGRAGGAFAASYGQALKADRAEKKAMANMQFNLADAQRKERMGLNKEAADAQRQAERDKLAAIKAQKDRLAAQAKLAQGMAVAAKPQRPTGAGGPKGPKEFEAGPEAYLADIKERFPDMTPAAQRALAFQTYQERKAPGLPGVTAKVEATAEEKARERAQKRALTDPALNAALRKRDSAAADARRNAILQEELKAPSAATPTAAPGTAANPIKIP